jgi:hypothetical protein
MRYAPALILALILASGCIEDPKFEDFNPDKNYCGPEGKFSVPRGTLSNADFNYACYAHDKCYHECRTNKRTQESCDKEFRQIMDDACDAAFDAHMLECEKKSKWNPLRYSCIASARARASSCWTQAATYHKTVSVGGAAIGSFTC